MKTKKPDNRPRYGYVADLDDDPQQVHEFRDSKVHPEWIPVVVIPLPYAGSAKLRKKVKEFVNGTLWPE